MNSTDVAAEVPKSSEVSATKKELPPVEKKFSEERERNNKSAGSIRASFDKLQENSQGVDLSEEKQELDQLDQELDQTDLQTQEQLKMSQASEAKPSFLDPAAEYQKALNEIQAESIDAQDPLSILERHIDKKGVSEDVIPERTRVFNAQDRLRHKLLELEARRQGVKDIKSFDALVDYFETRITDTESVDKNYKADISSADKEKIIKAWRSKGFRAYFDYEPRNGKLGFNADRDIPFNVGRDSVPVLKAILETGTDPIPFIEILRQNMRGLRSSLLYSGNLRANYVSETSKLIELLQDPHIDKITLLVQGMSSVPHTQWELSTYDNKKTQTDELRELAAGDVSAYSQEFFNKVSVLAKAMKKDVGVGELPKYEAIVSNPDKLRFLALVVESGNFPRAEEGFSVFDSLNSLEKDGLIKPITTLMQSGITIDGRIFGGYKTKSYDDSTFVSQEQVNSDLSQFVAEPTVQSILNDQDRQIFAQVLRKMNRASVPVELVGELYDSRQDLVALNNLIFSSLDTEYKSRYQFGTEEKIRTLKSMLSQDERRKILLSPEFQEFIKGLQKNKGITLEPQDFFRYEKDMFDHSEHPIKDEVVLVQLFKLREITDIIDPDMQMQKEIIEVHRENHTNEQFSKAYQGMRRLGGFTNTINTIKFLKKYDIPLDPKNFKDEGWIITVAFDMPLLDINALGLIPEEKKKVWIQTALSLPRSVQDGLRHSFLNKQWQYKVGSEDIERAVKLADVISSSDFFPKEHFTSDWRMKDLLSVLGEYRGDVKQLITDGKPNIELAKLLVQLKRTSALPLVLSEDVLSQYDEAQKSVLKMWLNLPDDLRAEVIEEAPDFPNVPPDKAEKYRVAAETISRIRNSPSAEIKRLEKELIGQLWKLDNPQQALEEIIGIFEKNNLPLVGKTYRVFETIYDNPNTAGGTTLESDLSSKVNLSPVLKAATPRERREIIYKDLLSINIKSGNPQLRDYLEVIRGGENVVAKMEEGGIEALTEREKQQLDHFFNKMDMLYASSLFGRTIENRRRQRQIDSSPVTSGLNPQDRLQALKRNFHVRVDQRLTDRLSEMFLRPIGFNRIEDVLAEMDRSKTEANNRNREFIKTGEGKIVLAAGDRFKGVNSSDLGKILERGAVAREYLGASAGSDATPYDTDTGLILEQDLTNGVASAVSASPSSGYGDLFLVVKNRGQFGNGEGQYESFASGVIGERHYGIRTGFSSAEIDAVIVKDTLTSDYRNLDDIFMTIAQNGVYIPVGKTDGTIIFTLEQFDEYRKTFDGVGEYSSSPISIRRVGVNEGSYAFPESAQVVASTRGALDQLRNDIKTDREKVQNLSNQIRARVSSALASSGVNLKGEFDTSIYGAELVDTGSTSRGTNLPGDYDFDLSLQLDPNDSKRLGEVSDVIKNALRLQEDRSHTETDYVQVRAVGSKIIEGETLDIDIGVGKRSDDGIFASNDAVSQKLDSIRQTLGDEAYYDVLANIVLTKKILKEGHAYKRLEDGGMGGIGVENWILLHNGNILDAFQSFWDTVHGENGNVLPYEEFAKKYKIFSAGLNIKYNRRDNFAQVLKPNGYNAMIGTIGQYLGYL